MNGQSPHRPIGKLQPAKCFLKFVPGPQRPVIDVAAGLCLLQELAGVENSIVSLKPCMPVGLPANLHARPVADESCLAVIPRSDQESRHRVDAIRKALSPLNYPIDGQRHVMRKRRFDVRMNVDEVDWPRTCCRQDAEVVSFGVKRIESAQRVRRWMISARYVRLRAEPRFQRNRGNSVARFRCDGPGADVCRSEAAKLPKCFIVEIPARVFVGDGLSYSAADRLPNLMRRSSLVCRFLAILPKVVKIQQSFLRHRARRVCTPEADTGDWRVVEESWIIFVRPHRKSVDMPRMCLYACHEAIEAEPNIGALAHIEEPARPILQFLPADSKLDRSPRRCAANLEKTCLEVKFFLIDWTRPPRTPRVNTALQLDECSDVRTIMDIEIGHVSLIEIAIPIGRIAPVVVSYLLPDFAGFATHGHVPIIATPVERDVFDRIPKVFSEIRILQEAPVLVLAKQLIVAVDLWNLFGVRGLRQ